MIRNPLSLLLLLLVGGLHAAAAQTSAPPLPDPTIASDPVLRQPVASLTPQQIAGMQAKLADWPQLGRYRDSNAALPRPQKGRVVFYGDSITDAWGRYDNNVFFPGKPYVNRGISGQTTPQMLVRFPQDVVALKPAAVLILAGTNDLAGNTGLSTVPMIEDNLRAMVTLAQANGIRVILASVLPVGEYPWRRGVRRGAEIRELNTWMQQYAGANHCTYLDYYTALADADGAMKPGTSKDGVHPTAAGYAMMAPLAQAAIDRTLRH